MIASMIPARRGFPSARGMGGAFFQARMAVAGSECAQTVTVSPQQSSYFLELSAALRKC